MNAWQLTNALAAFLLPPGSLILLMVAGIALHRRRPILGRALLAGGLCGLYLLSMPLISHTLSGLWETPPAPITADGAQAIVVLGGGRYLQAPEYGADTVASPTLERLRYAASLHRTSGLPVLVSGGHPDGGGVAEAPIMKQVLEREFAVPVRWTEAQSDNTLQNARFSFGLLRAESIGTILLVTHAWHMPRAQFVFEQSGFKVIPAPTVHHTRGALTLLDFLPDARELRKNSFVCHEIIGMFWYRLRLFLD